MKRYALLVLAAFTATACFDFFGPSTHNVSLNIVPQFDEFAAATLAANADQLRVIIERDSSGTFILVKDTVLTIDPVTGEASGSIPVVLLENVQEFRIRLEAFRASDGVIFFQGESVVSVSAGAAAADDDTQTISIPIQYAGLRGVRVAIAPRDTAVLVGSTFQLRATVFDTLDLPIEVPLTFNFVNPRDSVRLRVGRATGAAEAVSAGSQPVVVFVRTGDSLTDTTKVFVVAEADPVALRLDLGSATVAKDSTVQLSATLVNRTGTAVEGAIDWASRTSRVASVNPTGLVTGLVPGTSVVVARAQGFTDSLVVTVAADGRVVVTTTTEGRSFFESQVGGDIVVEVTADMSFAGSELLGSYNAAFTWNPSVLTLVAVQAGDFPVPEFNDANAAAGELRFAQISPSGLGGSVVLARIRFSKVGSGTTKPTVAITEMSAAVTFTNLLSRVSVTNGTVTVN